MMYLGFAMTTPSGTCLFDLKRPTTITAKSTLPQCRAFKGPVRSGSSSKRAYGAAERTVRSTAGRTLFRKNIGARFSAIPGDEVKELLLADSTYSAHVRQRLQPEANGHPSEWSTSAPPRIRVVPRARCRK